MKYEKNSASTYVRHNYSSPIFQWLGSANLPTKGSLCSYLLRCLEHLLQSDNAGVIQVLQGGGGGRVAQTIQKHTGRYSIKQANITCSTY